MQRVKGLFSPNPEAIAEQVMTGIIQVDELPKSLRRPVQSIVERLEAKKEVKPKKRKKKKGK